MVNRDKQTLSLPFNWTAEVDGIRILHMSPEPGVLRLPNPAYEGKNVFDADGAGVELSDGLLLDRYRTALFILTQKDRPIPT